MPALRLISAPTLLALLLTACGTLPDRIGFFTPGDAAPQHNVDLTRITDATPRIEAPSRYGNPKSYVVRGKRYHVMANSIDFKQQGIASWYGTKFHGRKTSSGEAYDMFTMTAAHKTLPLPTWVEVTNHDNQKRIIVKVNDRGPFISGRIIDLSYVAAAKLGVLTTGTARVSIRAIDPQRYLARKKRHAKNPGSATSFALSQPPNGNNNVQDEPHTKANTTPSLAIPAVISIPVPAPVTTLTHLPTTGENNLHSTDTPITIGTFYLQIAAFSQRSNAEQLRQRLLPLKPGKIHINLSPHSQPLYRVRIGPLTSLSEAGKIAAQITAMGLGEPKILLD